MNKYEIRRKNLIILKDKYCGGSISRLADKLGKSPSYVSRLLYASGRDNKKNIADRVTTDIENAFCLPMGSLDGLVHSIALNKKAKQTTHINGDSYTIEVLNISASARVGIINMDVIEVIRAIEYNDEQAYKLFGGRNQNNIRVINIKGDSMQGIFEPGDLAFIDITINRFDGDGIYVFIYERSLFVKRLQLVKNKLLVISDNKSYRDWDIMEDEHDKLFIQGKVLLSQSMHLRKHG